MTLVPDLLEGGGSRPQEAVVPTEPEADRWADLERLAKAADVPDDFRTRLVETIYQSLAEVEFCQSRMSYAAAIIAADAVMENLISSIDGKDISQ